MRSVIDEPAIEVVSREVRDDGAPAGYLGTPGAELMDIRQWRHLFDFALAAEKDPKELRALRFNARRYLPPGFLQATASTIEGALSQATHDWAGWFENVEFWPCLINYDVYANPVLPSWRAFHRDDGFWRGMRAFLREVQGALPSLLVLITTNLRGRSKDYDAALAEIFTTLRDYGIKVNGTVEQQFLGGGMPKKCQVCIPYWLSRFAATAEGFKVDIVDSLDYAGTQGVRMVHLILKLRPLANPASASEITLRKLVNFPHQTLVPDEKGGFRRDSGVHAVVGPANSGH